MTVLDLTTPREYQMILDALPDELKPYLQGRMHLVDDIALDVGQHFAVLMDDLSVTFDRVITAPDIELVLNNVGRPRADGRQGIGGTLHRFSAATNAGGEYTSISIRVGRYLMGMLEPLRPVIRQARGVAIVGEPFKGKTATLRDLMRLRAELQGKRLSVVDTSDELLGPDVKPHPCVGAAKRVSVGDPARQKSMIAYALQNNSPRELLTDEIGPRDDVPLVVEYANKGVFMNATLHARDAGQAFANLTYRPLWGLDAQRQQTGLPIFSMIIEVVDKGVYNVIENVPKAVTSWLEGEPIEHYCVDTRTPQITPRSA
ncbi:AAA family ATPase [Deinococcus sp. HMF7620]|uniref:AAA family ATPase n=1 Tax=Deinococcus arboris TaxID=2682977 RepID=A0A7C9M2H2_9DEIO|nr:MULTISPECIES: AAA family ATPase [Deinococcus]MBZ9752204.1 AAA family ATPase [Deinococcus betulae]MVN87542.1 AAA family ATPase [Deinococcus arboris]